MVTWGKLIQPAGGGTMNAVEIASDGRVLGASDTQGLYLTEDHANHWKVINAGIGTANQGMSAAACAWSVSEPGAVYAAVGDQGAGGGFMAAPAPGQPWVLRTAAVQFAGNHAASNIGGAFPRSTGRLIGQDNSFVYVGTYNHGVARSSVAGGAGNDDFPVTATMGGSAPGTGYWCRSIWVGASGNVWAGFYDTTGANGGLWKCTNPQAASPNFIRVAGTPATVEDIVTLDSYAYCACGPDGIWQLNVGTGAWRNLNGTTVDTSSSIWNGIDVKSDGLSHTVGIVCGSPVSGASFIRLTIPSLGAGSPSYRPMVTADVDRTHLQPDGQAYSIMGSGLQLSQSGAKNLNIRFDPTDPAGQRVYICGSNSFFRSEDNGDSWLNCSLGDAAFHVYVVACDPNHDKHVVFETTDYGSVELSDGIGYDSSTCFDRSPGGQSRCFAFDPIDSTMYTGISLKSDQTSGGDMMTKAWDATVWSSMGLGALISQYPVIGVETFRNASNQKVVVAATESHGIWRWISGSWTQVSVAAFASQQTPLTGSGYAGSGVVYFFDREQGIFRSTNYGTSWSLIWSGTASGNFSTGFIACNPAVAGELWVSANNGLYRLSSANGSPVEHVVTHPGDNGPIVISSDGVVYLGTQDTGSGLGIYRSMDSGATWEDLDPDGSFANTSYAVYQLAISPGGVLYAGTGNIVTLPITPTGEPVAITLSNTFANALLGAGGTDSVADQIGGGTLVIYAGAAPPGPNEAPSGNTVLATFTFSAAGAQGTPASGSMNLSFVALTVAASGTGTATFYRVINSSGTALIQGSITATGGGGDWQLSSTAITANDNITITGTPTMSWTTA